MIEKEVEWIQWKTAHRFEKPELVNPDQFSRFLHEMRKIASLDNFLEAMKEWSI